MDYLFGRMGFKDKWRMWMKAYITGTSYSMLASVLTPVQAARGLRKGDPLSPFSFTMVAEGKGGPIVFHFSICK